jgi:hypothetical protein
LGLFCSLLQAMPCPSSSASISQLILPILRVLQAPFSDKCACPWSSHTQAVVQVPMSCWRSPFSRK